MSLTLRRTVFLDGERRPDDYEIRYAGRTVDIYRLHSTQPRVCGTGARKAALPIALDEAEAVPARRGRRARALNLRGCAPTGPLLGSKERPVARESTRHRSLEFLTIGSILRSKRIWTRRTAGKLEVRRTRRLTPCRRVRVPRGRGLVRG
jgi:hypothetical protein